MTKETAYAEAIMEAVERGMAPEEAVQRARGLLNASGRGALLPKIGAALRRLGKQRERASVPEVAFAREADRAVALRDASSAYGKELGAARTRVDPALIGGWVLTTADTRIDASFRNELRDLYRHITA